MALKLYVETSVWSAVLRDSQPDIQGYSRDFLQHASSQGMTLYVSPTVGKEMAQAPEPLGKRLLHLLDEWGAVVIRPTSEVRALANAFVERGIIPLRYSADAEHLAFAIVGGADAIVSWNLDHIVKLKTKMAVRVLAVEYGYRLIDVVTPLEVLERVD